MQPLGDVHGYEREIHVVSVPGGRAAFREKYDVRPLFGGVRGPFASRSAAARATRHGGPLAWRAKSGILAVDTA
ncbi:hypothetical protein GCM10009678_57290 [Actinomadura kijaniata]